eukprot:6895365-Alexandrium_andersonii.AAC.1
MAPATRGRPLLPGALGRHKGARSPSRRTCRSRSGSRSGTRPCTGGCRRGAPRSAGSLVPRGRCPAGRGRSPR